MIRLKINLQSSNCKKEWALYIETFLSIHSVKITMIPIHHQLLRKFLEHSKQNPLEVTITSATAQDLFLLFLSFPLLDKWLTLSFRKENTSHIKKEPTDTEGIKIKLRLQIHIDNQKFQALDLIFDQVVL